MAIENHAGLWRPASGMVGGDGCTLWRVVIDQPGHFKQHTRSDGKPWFARSFRAAQKCADILNGKHLRIPKRVQRIVDVVNGGQVLHKSLRRKNNGETEVQFYFEPSGKIVPTKSAQQAVASGLLHDAGDGLLPELSQTWRGAA